MASVTRRKFLPLRWPFSDHRGLYCMYDNTKRGGFEICLNLGRRQVPDEITVAKTCPHNLPRPVALSAWCLRRFLRALPLPVIYLHTFTPSPYSFLPYHFHIELLPTNNANIPPQYYSSSKPPSSFISPGFSTALPLIYCSIHPPSAYQPYSTPYNAT